MSVLGNKIFCFICTIALLQGIFLTDAGSVTIEDVIKEKGERRRPLLSSLFKQRISFYPPKRLTLIAIKETKRLELWSPDNSGEWRFIIDYPIYGLSGGIGPKLKQGDLQTPEGIYNVVELNPNSSFHLSMKLNYPNEFDVEMARLDGREDLGGDIYIHGDTQSKGCLAIGDLSIEELFILIYDVRPDHVEVLITPLDFRIASHLTKELDVLPLWTAKLYKKLTEELNIYRQNPFRLGKLK